jgi:hypothetical protein
MQSLSQASTIWLRATEKFLSFFSGPDGTKSRGQRR